MKQNFKKVLHVFPRKYYERSTLEIAQDLLGNYLVKKTQNSCLPILCKIIEVEAYLGREDNASHARFGYFKDNLFLPTNRAANLYGPPGLSYVYQIYGVHHCLNVVAHPKGKAGAILIREIEVFNSKDACLLKGPGRICSFLNISKEYNGMPLTSTDSMLWIAAAQRPLRPAKIICLPRINIEYAKEDAKLLYRFRLEN